MGSSKYKGSVISDWKEERWIGWSDELSSLPAARWLHAQSITPSFVSNNISAQVNAVASGFGLALVPEASSELAPVAPVRFAKHLAESASAWPKDELWLVGHRALRDVPRVAAVWQCLLGVSG
jgi:DNA-binding transcriptional LysR family regulator